MRYRTRFPGDKKQKTVYMNLHFPAGAVFPDADEVWDIGLVPNASEPNAADLKGRVEFMDPLERLILREEDPERFSDGSVASSEIGEIEEIVSRSADEIPLDPKALDQYQPHYCGGTIESVSPYRQISRKFLRDIQSRRDARLCETHYPKRQKYGVRNISLAQNIG